MSRSPTLHPCASASLRLCLTPAADAAVWSWKGPEARGQAVRWPTVFQRERGAREERRERVSHQRLRAGPAAGRIAKELGSPALSVDISRKPRRSPKTKTAHARLQGPGILLRHQPPPDLTTPRSHARTFILRPRAPFPTLSSSPRSRSRSLRAVHSGDLGRARCRRRLRGANRGRDRGENAGVAIREEPTLQQPPPERPAHQFARPPAPFTM